MITRLTCYTSACCSPVFDCLYSKSENVMIPNRRRLPKNRKSSFFSQSQKLVSTKHKKSPIRKIKKKIVLLDGFYLNWPKFWISPKNSNLEPLTLYSIINRTSGHLCASGHTLDSRFLCCVVVTRCTCW